jgi:hypothetical protein
MVVALDMQTPQRMVQLPEIIDVGDFTEIFREQQQLVICALVCLVVLVAMDDQTTLRIEQEVARQVVDHDGVSVAESSAIFPDDLQRLRKVSVVAQMQATDQRLVAEVHAKPGKKRGF